MQQSADARQTPWSVAGIILTAMAMCVLRPMFFDNLYFDAGRAPTDALQGGILGSWFVMAEYARLPIERRLGSRPTIVLALGYLALVSWVMLTAPRAMDWILVLIHVVMSLPGAYLLLKGMQSIRSARA